MNQAHLDMDDSADFAVGPMQEMLRAEAIKREEAERMEAERLAFLSADYTKRERQYVEMQGRPAWPARRCSPEVQPVPAEAATEIGAEDQSESADAEVMVWLLKGLCVVVTALLCAWVIAWAAYV